MPIKCVLCKNGTNFKNFPRHFEWNLGTIATWKNIFSIFGNTIRWTSNWKFEVFTTYVKSIFKQKLNLKNNLFNKILRFKSPLPAKNWTGIRQANQFGNRCPQLNGMKIGGDEDCLFLNIYTPLVNFNETLVNYLNSNSF